MVAYISKNKAISALSKTLGLKQDQTKGLLKKVRGEDFGNLSAEKRDKLAEKMIEQAKEDNIKLRGRSAGTTKLRKNIASSTDALGEKQPKKPQTDEKAKPARGWKGIFGLKEKQGNNGPIGGRMNHFRGQQNGAQISANQANTPTISLGLSKQKEQTKENKNSRPQQQNRASISAAPGFDISTKGPENGPPDMFGSS